MPGYIHVYRAHFEEKITLDDLASHLGISKSYLSEFMSKVSIGFSNMVSYIRANKSECS